MRESSELNAGEWRTCKRDAGADDGGHSAPRMGGGGRKRGPGPLTTRWVPCSYSGVRLSPGACGLHPMAIDGAGA